MPSFKKKIVYIHIFYYYAFYNYLFRQVNYLKALIANQIQRMEF